MVESLGGWGEEAIRVVRRLVGALDRHTGQDEKDVLRFQFGRLALSLQRDNAAILENHIPTFPGMAIGHRWPALSETKHLSDPYTNHSISD